MKFFQISIQKSEVSSNLKPTMNSYSQSQPIFGNVIFNLTGILSDVPGLFTNSSLTLQQEEQTMNQIDMY